jgi:nicotinamidase-related amidase
MHWRIWFDLYEDDKKIGSGVWRQPYTQKHDAVRVARRKFGYAHINKNTGKVYTYKWVVSQYNPRQGSAQLYFDLKGEKHMKVLVVVDMQNDFIDGSLGTMEAQAIVPNVKKKIDEAVANNDLIIYTRDTHFGDYLKTKEGQKLPVEHCIFGTDGWRIREELMPPADYEHYDVFDKYTFGHTALPLIIRKIMVNLKCIPDCTEIEVVGLCTDICVVSNALMLKAEFYDEFEVTVHANCCAGVTPETHEAALKTMEMCQINVIR